MRRREAIRKHADKLVLAAMTGDWVTAKQVSQTIKMPWRIAARTLKRLAAQGEVDSQEKVTHDYKFRMRVRPEYRKAQEITMTDAPEWVRMFAGFTPKR